MPPVAVTCVITVVGADCKVANVAEHELHVPADMRRATLTVELADPVKGVADVSVAKTVMGYVPAAVVPATVITPVEAVKVIPAGMAVDMGTVCERV